MNLDSRLRKKHRASLLGKSAMERMEFSSEDQLSSVNQTWIFNWKTIFLTEATIFGTSELVKTTSQS